MPVSWSGRGSLRIDSLLRPCAAAVLCWSLAGVVGLPQHRPVAPRHWSVAASYAPVPMEVRDVSCPTAQLCVAVGATTSGTGLVLRSTDGARHWATEPVPYGTGLLNGVACPTPTRCEAVVYSAAGLGDQILGSSNGGISWHDQYVDPTADLADLESVRCVDADHCVATGSGSAGEATLLATSDGGANWHSISPFGPNDGMGIEGADCTSPTTCLAVGWAGQGLSTVGVLAITTNGGITWSAPPIPANLAIVWSIDCASASDCVALAQLTGTAYQQGGDTVLTTTDGGATWASNPLPASWQLLFVACPSANTCYATGWRNLTAGPTALLATSGDGGRTWGAVPLPGAAVTANGLSCTSTTSCTLGAETARKVPEILRLRAGAVDASAPLPTGVAALYTVSCASASWCLAAGDRLTAQGEVAAAVTSGDGGRHWSAHTASTLLGSLSVAACASASVCEAVGSGGAAGIVSVFSGTRDGGATWKLQLAVPYDIYGLSCATTTSCAATGGIEVYFSPRTKGHWRPSIIPASIQVLNDVACPSVHACLAVGATAKGRALLARSPDGGRSWGQVQLLAPSVQLVAITCSSALVCVAVGGASGAHRATNGAAIEVTSDGGRTWRRVAVPDTAPELSSVACERAMCLALGGTQGSPSVLRSTDGGARWSYAPSPPGIAALETVTCGPTRCWAVGVTPTDATRLLAWR